MSAVETHKPARRAKRRASARLKSVAGFLVVVATTYLGLLAVTFFIGRVVPIDPVLAIVGDRAPAHVVERVRQEMGLDLPYYQQFWLYLKGVWRNLRQIICLLRRLRSQCAKKSWNANKIYASLHIYRLRASMKWRELKNFGNHPLWKS